MPLELENHLIQSALWPREGRHILAQFDAESVVVYQAFNPEIGEFAARNGYFERGFSLNRMSWIKPNFLWMMARCGWGQKENQEAVLAVRIRRAFWEEILAQAVPSSFAPQLYSSTEEWKRDVEASQVRLQWDPDHAPNGAKLERRAVQLGLRGEILRRYTRQEILGIEHVGDLVETGRLQLKNGDSGALQTPRERVYTPQSEGARRLGMETEIAA